MHISYDHKNGTEYAKIAISHWENGKDHKSYINLGRVLDKENGIYVNRKRGVFHYDLETDTYSEVKAPDPQKNDQISFKSNELLNFGDVWFLDHFIRQDGLIDCIQAILPAKTDMILCLVCFYVLNQLGLCHAEDWYEHSIASLLYPGLDCSSSGTSEFLRELSPDVLWQRFFHKYSEYLQKVPGDVGKIIIDSTGLPNSIHFPLTAVNCHNGTVSNELRMELIVEQETGIPVYMRYMCGSIPDVSTIQVTLAEMEQFNMGVNDILVDAGYYSDPNFQAMVKDKVNFICRLKENLDLYKELFALHREELIREENTFKYGNRAIFIKEVETAVPIDKKVNPDGPDRKRV